jgi:hypothetical protein
VSDSTSGNDAMRGWRFARPMWPPALLAMAMLAAYWAPPARGAVLPEDRADVMYHVYDGGGITIQGPSMLVRRQFAGQVSLAAHYYVDQVSSASIDVVTTASPYTEQRKEYSLGVDYLHDRWIMSFAYGASEERDYSAETFNFGVTQDFFGDLTTLSLGYTLARDEVRRRGDPLFAEDVRRQHYRIGLSQILTRNLILGLSFETITDQGFLNNPYRSVRYLDSDSPLGYSYEQELYPSTRTSDAGAVRLRYHLPYRAALHGEYRTYADSWGVRADTWELGYTHPVAGGWVIDTKLRLYSQNGVNFFSDLFPRAEFQNFRSRHKELSPFSSHTVRVGLRYDILRSGWRFLERGSVSFVYDRIEFDYEEFRDLRHVGVTPGEEPLYRFGANVFQVFASFWF